MAEACRFRSCGQFSISRYAALHRAMDPGLQEGDFGFAVEWPERRVKELAAKACLADRADRRAFGFVPCNVEAIVGHRPRNLQPPARGGKRAVFSGVGGKLVKDQRKASRQL